MPHARIVLNHRLRLFVLIAAALALPGMVNGEDIDLYTVNTTGGGQPNVLLVLDNADAANAAFKPVPSGSSACSTFGLSNTSDLLVDQCALYNLVQGIGSSTSQLNGKVNMGLMMFAPDSTGGGRFFYPGPTPAPGPLPLLDSAGASNFMTAILSGGPGGTGMAFGAGSNKVDESMQEAYAFFSGTQGISGTKYKKPTTDTCQQNFIIYLANVTGNNSPKTSNNVSLPQSKLTTANGGVTPGIIPLTPSGDQQNWADEWAQFMYSTADLSGIPASTAHTRQNIITYTIAVTDGCDTGRNPSQKCIDHVNLIKSMASYGGGKYFYVNGTDTNAVAALISAFNTILTEVQATNSVFASVSLPVSVNAQGTSLNQVYVGMFRPDAGGAPRWAGNLKQYQLGFYTDLNGSQQVQMEDSLRHPAITNSGTGFITPNALSFWTADHLPATLLTTLGTTTQLRDGPFQVNTTSTPVTNWPSFNTPPTTTPPTPPSGFWVHLDSTVQGSGGTFDAPDGQIVDKGGVAEMTRADYLTDQTIRAIYTCPTSGCTRNAALSTTKFDVATLGSNTTFGTSTTTTPTTTNLINWIRGTDNNTGTGIENPAGPGGLGSTPVRPSIHGDVLHSRPAVVNYGGSIGIVVFYGSNDGLFRAVNGNTGAPSTATTPPPTVITTTSTPSAPTRYVRPGGELWSFIAPDFFGKFQHLYNNTPSLTLGATATGSGKDYFFDGTTTVYQDLRTTPSKTYIYVTARRGGRLIYAFDVSDPTAPAFLWSKTNVDIPALGQTWSQPKLALINGNTNPVLIMGGGYAPEEDADPVGAPDSMGNAIVVLDAFSGNPVWTACPSGCTTNVTAMTYAIPADVTLLDTNGDGYTDRLYTADLGGNIWRADINDADSTKWTVTQLASLGGTGTNARKFFYPPDVTPTGSFDAVVAASGDREHPLLANAASTVFNRYYMLQDTNTGLTPPSGWTTITESMLTDATAALTGGTPYAYSSSTGAPKGFFITLGGTTTNAQGVTTSNGEKAVNAPLTVAGYTYFGTNTPDASSNTFVCKGNLGLARGYAINFLTGAGLNGQGYVPFDGGGLPPSPVFGLVEVTANSGVYTPVLIGGGNQTGPGGGNNSSALGANKVTPPNTGKRKRTYWFTEGLK